LRVSWLSTLLDFIFGYDFFISYSRADGSTYAVDLARKLKERGYECFLDADDFVTGNNWRVTGARALRKSSRLILVGSPRVHSSEPVLSEVRTYLSTQREIIPVSFDGSLEKPEKPSPLLELVGSEVLRIEEDGKCLEKGVSEGALGKIIAAFTVLRQDRKRVRMLGLSALVFAVVALLALFFWSRAETESRRARSNLSGNDLLLGEVNLRQGDLKEGLFWYWRAYNDGPEGDDRRARARSLIASWIPFAGSPLWHEESVDQVAFAPKGQKLVTLTRGGVARIWDAVRLVPVGQPMRHETNTPALAISPDGEKLLTGSRDGTARLWSLATGDPLTQPLPHNSYVQAVAFHPNSRLFVTGTYDGLVRIWDAAQREPRARMLRHGATVDDVSFSPDGRTILTVGDNTLRLWDLETGAEKPPAIEHSGVKQARFSPDGKILLSGGAEHSARLWEVTTRVPRGLPLTHEDDIQALAFSPQGDRVATASLDETARLWDSTTGEPIGSPMQHQLPIESVAFSPDGKKILTGSNDGTARLWDAYSGLPIGVPMKHELKVLSVAFSPDGRKILTGSEDQTARLWDSNLGLPARGFPLAESPTEAMALSHDGTRLAIGRGYDSVDLWGLQAGKPLCGPMSHESLIKAIAFSPDDQVLLVATDNAWYRWDTKTCALLHPPMPHEISAMATSFSIDALTLATGTGSVNGKFHVRVWNTTTGQVIGKPLPHQDRIAAVALNPAGSLVATGSFDRRFQVWTTRDGKPYSSSILLEEAPRSLIWTPDGKMLIVGVVGSVRFWDVQNRRFVSEIVTEGFLGEDDWANAAAISPDGRSLIVLLGGAARIWDVSSGQPRGETMRPPGGISAAALANDRAWTAGEDGTIGSWDLAPPLPDDPDRIVTLVEWVTGFRLGAGAEPQVQDTESLLKRRLELLRPLSDRP
jgi:WD40 repeat protein